MSRSVLLLAACLSFAACASDRRRAPLGPGERPPTPQARSFDPAAPPPEWAAAVARGDAAIAELQRRLAARLAAALQQDGPAGAVTVCRDEAPRLTAAIGEKLGVSLGRTSDRLRNPGNTAPAWASQVVEASTGQPAAQVRPAAFVLGDRLGLLRPIVVAQPCTSCHGAPASIAPEVKSQLAREYAVDRAVGYARGDHRGFFWAEVPR